MRMLRYWLIRRRLRLRCEALGIGRDDPVPHSLLVEIGLAESEIDEIIRFSRRRALWRGEDARTLTTD